VLHIVSEFQCPDSGQPVIGDWCTIEMSHEQHYMFSSFSEMLTLSMLAHYRIAMVKQQTAFSKLLMPKAVAE